MSLAAPLQGPVSLNLPFAPTSAGEVRRALVAWLQELGSSRAVIQDVQLVATELIANAIRHADPIRSGGLLVRWKSDGDVLTLSVTDGGSVTSQPHTVDAAPDAESGRGLSIVEELCLSWKIVSPHGLTDVSVRMALV